MHVPLIIKPLKALQNDVSNYSHLNTTGWSRNQLSLKHLIWLLMRRFSFQAKTFIVYGLSKVCAKSYAPKTTVLLQVVGKFRFSKRPLNN